MKKLLAILLLAACLFSLMGCKKGPDKEVAGFIFTDTASFMPSYNFRRYVDLQSGKIWGLDKEHYAFRPQNWDAREFPGEDPNEEGFFLITELSPEAVEHIKKACIKCHMPDWEGIYKGTSFVEGYWWLTILYTDGTVQTIEGLPYTYPKGIGKLAQALLDETGRYIFRKEIDPEDYEETYRVIEPNGI